MPKKKGNQGSGPKKVLGIKRKNALDFSGARDVRGGDPSIGAERRALERGLEDLYVDTSRDVKRGRQDLRTTRRDLRTTERRGLRDIGLEETRGLGDLSRELSRGVQDIGFQRQDIRTSLARGREDFSNALTNLIHDFQVEGQQQAQVANSAGITGGTTAQAAAAARAGNLARARQPLDTSLQRLGQDTMRGLARLGTEEGRLRSDVGTGRSRLRQDTGIARKDLTTDVQRDTGLAKRDFRRSRQDWRRQLKRGVREQRIGDIDLRRQQVFSKGLYGRQ